MTATLSARQAGTNLMVVVPKQKNRIVVANPRPKPTCSSPYIEQKLAEIKREYGARLSCHPDYKPTARHSLNPEVYIPARAEYLKSIAAAAKRDRESNPVYQLAQRVRHMIEGEIA